MKIELESLISMNHYWSQVQNVCKNDMTIDTGERTINVPY